MCRAFRCLLLGGCGPARLGPSGFRFSETFEHTTAGYIVISAWCWGEWAMSGPRWAAGAAPELSSAQVIAMIVLLPPEPQDADPMAVPSWVRSAIAIVCADPPVVPTPT